MFCVFCSFKQEIISKLKLSFFDFLPKMASSSSAVLDVVIENKEIPSVFKETKELDLSICSDSNYDNSLVSRYIFVIKLG